MSTKERINSPISWSLPELMEGLKVLLQVVAKKTKICLFVDGLDEFDGDHDEIIRLFRNIVNAGDGNVKVCLSSRPWPVFEAAFEYVPQLKLQDLTLKDRQHYVVDKFNKDSRMRYILRKEPESGANMMDKIVERADGVFLWVILAVRTLLKDLRTGDSVEDINDRLTLLPTDLEDFFRHTLFNSQTDLAKREASRVLQLIRARELVCEFTGDYSASSMTLWELALAHLNAEDSDQAMTLSVCQVTNEQVLRLCDNMKSNIESHCAGLLGIHSKKAKNLHQMARYAGGDLTEQLYILAQSKVTYLHRTIRDWLIYSPSVWNTVVEFTTSPAYDPHANLLGSYILQLKLPFEEPEHHRRLDEWWPGIVLSLTHARYAHPLGFDRDASQAVELIDELEKTLSWYWLMKSSQPDDHWARNAFGSYEQRNKSIVSYPVLALATKFGLREYVMTKVQRAKHNGGDLGYKGGRPLLSYATDFLVNRRKTVFPLSACLFVSHLLSSGQDPNLVYTDFGGREETPWLSCVKFVREALRRDWITQQDRDVVRWTQILTYFVDYGANVNAIIVATKWDPEITVLEVVDSVYERFELEELRELRKAMVAKGAGSGMKDDESIRV